MYRYILPDLISKAKISTMTSKHAAAVISGKCMLAMATNYSLPENLIFDVLMKDINVLKEKMENHETGSTVQSSKRNMKNVVRIKRQIQRTGLILARNAEENAIEKYQASIGKKGR